MEEGEKSFRKGNFIEGLIEGCKVVGGTIHKFPGLGAMCELKDTTIGYNEMSEEINIKHSKSNMETIINDPDEIFISHDKDFPGMNIVREKKDGSPIRPAVQVGIDAGKMW